MGNSSKEVRDNLAKEATLGLKLVKKMRELMKQKIMEHGELDDHWDLKLNPDLVDEGVIQSDEFYSKYKKIFDHLWDEVYEEALYEMRQGKQDELDKERTDLRAFNIEKSRTANKINKRYNR